MDERELARTKLKEAQKPMMAMFKEQKKDRRSYGREMIIPVGDKEYKCWYQPGEGEITGLYFDIHGGGFTWGTKEDGDIFCHEIRDQIGLACFGLDYPLTPQAEFPTQLDVLYETIAEIRKMEKFKAASKCMVIGGRSAGGNLAAALCYLAKERGEFQFNLQILDHPWLDLCDHIQEERYSGSEALNQEILYGMRLGYASREQWKDKLVSPIMASVEEMQGLPAAIIQTCGLDSLQPDGKFYAKKLEEAGVSVSYHDFPGVVHGFTEDIKPESEEGRQWLISQMKQYLKKQG